MVLTSSMAILKTLFGHNEGVNAGHFFSDSNGKRLVKSSPKQNIIFKNNIVFITSLNSQIKSKPTDDLV